MQSRKLPLVPGVDYSADNNTASRIDWSVLSDEVIRDYDANTDLLLSNAILPTEALLCKDCECTNENHRNSLYQYYDHILETMRLAGVNTIHTHHTDRRSEFNRPGWTEFASDLYDMSRDVYFYGETGYPRQRELFYMKNRAKVRFKQPSILCITIELDQR